MLDHTGWELGAWAGLDFNTGPAGSFGLFAGARWGEFTTGACYGGLPVLWGGSASHGWLDVGVRWAWWPWRSGPGAQRAAAATAAW